VVRVGVNVNVDAALPSVLVILDGASEPLRRAPTSLERAATPALDALAAAGELSRVRTVAPWLAPGSESAIPALLGWVPPSPVDRGLVEAAARGLPVPPGARAWRVDVRVAGTGARADAAAVAPAVVAALPAHDVHAIGGHRLLVVGEEPLPALVPPSLDVVLHPWSEGIVPSQSLDATTVVIAAEGAAAGIARLMGAHVVVPAGATGRPRSDLAAKAAAALAALRAGAAQVVIHVGGADEAAHERDAAAKVAVLEQADRDMIAPLAAALCATGGTLAVCPDHGCDPSTGLHDDTPVPRLDWSVVARGAGGDGALGSADEAASDASGARAGGVPGRAGGSTSPARPRLTERAVAALPVAELATRELAAA